MTTPEIHPHEVEAIRALVNLHDPDTQPDEWHPDDHATAETAAQLLRPLLARTDADAVHLPELDQLEEQNHR